MFGRVKPLTQFHKALLVDHHALVGSAECRHHLLREGVLDVKVGNKEMLADFPSGDFNPLVICPAVKDQTWVRVVVAQMSSVGYLL